MRKRLSLVTLIAAGAFSQTASQNARDSYRGAYRAWREADPAIEHDAPTAGPGIVALRATRLAGLQSQYAAARAQFLQGLIATATPNLLWLEDARAIEPSMSQPKSMDDYLSTEDASVRRGTETFANDTDRGMQPLQQALDRERKALASLTSAVEIEHKAADAYGEAASATEQLILGATVEGRLMVAGIRQTLDETTKDAEAWAEYYRTLAAH